MFVSLDVVNSETTHPISKMITLIESSLSDLCLFYFDEDEF